MRPHRRQPTRLPRPWDSSGKNTGVGVEPLLVVKIMQISIFYMLNMHKEGRNETTNDNESLIRQFIFASILTQACKTHLWNEMIYYQSLGKCCPISRCSFGISGSPASQQRDTLVHPVLHFNSRIASQRVLFNHLKEKLQNFLTCLVAMLFVLHLSFVFAIRGDSSDGSRSN